MLFVKNAPAEIQNAWVTRSHSVPAEMEITWESEKFCPLELPAVEALWDAGVNAPTAQTIARRLQDPEALAYLVRKERRKTVLEAILYNRHTPTQALADVADAPHIVKHDTFEPLIINAALQRGPYQVIEQLGVSRLMPPKHLVAAAKDGAQLGATYREYLYKSVADKTRLSELSADEWTTYFRACLEYRLPLCRIDTQGADAERLAVVWEAVRAAATPGMDPRLWGTFLEGSAWDTEAWRGFRLTRPRVALASSLVPGHARAWTEIRPASYVEYENCGYFRSNPTRTGRLYPDLPSLDYVVQTGFGVIAWEEITTAGGSPAAADLLLEWLRATGPLTSTHWRRLWGTRPPMGDRSGEVHREVVSTLQRGWEAGYYGHEYAALDPFVGHYGRINRASAVERPMDAVLCAWRDHVAALPITEEAVTQIFATSSSQLSEAAGQVLTERLEQDPTPGVAHMVFDNAHDWKGFGEQMLALLTPDEVRSLRGHFDERREWMWSQADCIAKYVLVHLLEGQTLREAYDVRPLLAYNLVPLVEAGIIQGDALRHWVLEKPEVATGIVLERLGDDLAKWDLLQSLYEGWGGSFPDLLDTVVTLSGE